MTRKPPRRVWVVSDANDVVSVYTTERGARTEAKAFDRQNAAEGPHVVHAYVLAPKRKAKKKR